ncbi:uncharacterized protein LOC117316820 [Pecten maximus]|uniref:uncharacterized protein LOC117316820 n=1 Tax=Pecten maximus TaxID=6579 RepID=UPI0014582192|nr:uncharacterized protein LOC117316820 [Pecten maximus]
MYPPSRAARFLVVIGFSFFVLLLHSIDKRQTYARLEFIDVNSGWYQNSVSGHDKNRSSGGREKNSFEVCEKTYNVEFQTVSAYASQRIYENLHLNSDCFVIEVGGFEGEAMRTLFQVYDIGFYVVVEPIWKYYKTLIKKSKHLPQGRIQALNIGLGEKDDTVKVKTTGNWTGLYNGQTKNWQSENGDNGTKPEQMADINIIGVERFFKEIGIGSTDGVRGQLDLLILDCEGCEYDVLDYLVKSPNVLHYIRVIMFRSHRFKGHEQEMIHKYCTYQELLPLTHEILFQKKFSWEVWRLRNKM